LIKLVTAPSEPEKEKSRRTVSLFLNTKVGRRTVFLFLLCAVIPISVIAGVAYLQVSNHLKDESLSRLRDAAKSEGMGVLDRLDFALQETSRYQAGPPQPIESMSPVEDEAEEEDDGVRRAARLNGVVRQESDGSWTTLADSGFEPPLVSEEQRQRLGRGRPILTTEVRNGDTEVFLGLPVTDADEQTIWSQISQDYLWMFVVEGQFGADVCVLDEMGKELICNLQDPEPLKQSLAEASSSLATRHTSQFEWEYYGEPFLGAHWTMFMNYAFGAPSWTIVRVQSESSVLMSMEQFKKTFPLLLLLSLWFVIFISTFQIRRSTEPLEQLAKGTSRLAQQDFSTMVTVHSKDEYEDLAASFNSMAENLQDQFQTLNALNAVDHAALTGSELHEILQAGLNHAIQISSATMVGIALPEDWKEPLGEWELNYQSNNGDSVSRDSILVGPDEWNFMCGQDDHFEVPLRPPPKWLHVDALNDDRLSKGAVFPIRIRKSLTGMMIFGYGSNSAKANGELGRLRLLANQISIAVSNSRLVEDLDELNWGALTALARTIDAKSPWTKGHSERVTTLSLGLAEVLSLQDTDKELLQRGGLLHDIGKIGIPQEILDKPGKLTAQEMQVMRTHPTIGARILRPIKSYSDIIPMVLYHHEWYDGRGYPEGLAGQDIHYLARVMALPDVYDALTSPRPYRSSMTHEDAMEIINRGIGTQFDPEFGRAFNSYMGSGKLEPENLAGRVSARWHARDSGEAVSDLT